MKCLHGIDYADICGTCEQDYKSGFATYAHEKESVEMPRLSTEWATCVVESGPEMFEPNKTTLEFHPSKVHARRSIEAAARRGNMVVMMKIQTVLFPKPAEYEEISV